MDVAGATDVMILYGNSHPELANLIARYFFLYTLYFENYYRKTLSMAHLHAQVLSELPHNLRVLIKSCYSNLNS